MKRCALAASTRRNSNAMGRGTRVAQVRGMPPSHLSIMFSSVAAIAALTFTNEASASHLDACGGIWLDAEAAGRCEVVPKESCETKCEPASTERVCATRLYQQCAPSCEVTAEVECQSSCVETCDTECSASASVDCSSLCIAECSGGISDSCGDTTGQCGEQGGACCAASCDAHCEAEASAECTTVCDTACTGSCEARAEMDCQIECQTAEFQSCTDVVVQECNEECETTGAAIFCDGHFLATGGDLEACAAELKAEFEVEIDVSVDVDVDITAGDDDGGGDQDDDDDIDDVVGCSVAGPGAGTMGLLVLMVLGARVGRRRNAA